jgi:hypothetical protein
MLRNSRKSCCCTSYRSAARRRVTELEALIDYAHSLGKPIRYTHPAPCSQQEDEGTAPQP